MKRAAANTKVEIISTNGSTTASSLGTTQSNEKFLGYVAALLQFSEDFKTENCKNLDATPLINFLSHFTRTVVSRRWEITEVSELTCLVSKLRISANYLCAH